MQYYEHRWPILNHDMTRAELIEEAREALARELDARGVHALSHPVFSWPDPFTSGGPCLVARLAVTDSAAVIIPAMTWQVPA